MKRPIGFVGDLEPGELCVFVVAGDRVAVTTVGDQVYAIDDTCTHMGCSLASGDLDGTTVTCPCHGSQFDVRSGAVLQGPAVRPVRAWDVFVDGDELAIEA